MPCVLSGDVKDLKRLRNATKGRHVVGAPLYCLAIRNAGIDLCCVEPVAVSHSISGEELAECDSISSDSVSIAPRRRC